MNALPGRPRADQFLGFWDGFGFGGPGGGGALGSTDGHGESGSIDTQADGGGGPIGQGFVGANAPPQERPNGKNPPP